LTLVTSTCTRDDPAYKAALTSKTELIRNGNNTTQFHTLTHVKQNQNMTAEMF